MKIKLTFMFALLFSGASQLYSMDLAEVQKATEKPTISIDKIVIVPAFSGTDRLAFDVGDYTISQPGIYEVQGERLIRIGQYNENKTYVYVNLSNLTRGRLITSGNSVCLSQGRWQIIEITK